MHKSLLHMFCDRQSWSWPAYTISKAGPDHDPRFKATVTVNGALFTSPDFSKVSKEAENEAAKVALEHIFSSDRSDSGGGSSGGAADIPPAEIQLFYKKQLQDVALKTDFSPPVYAGCHDDDCDTLGFKATVTIDGETFKSPEFCSTLKEAEDAAAKVALLSLGERRFHKSLLQELTQKNGLAAPVYRTVKSGSSHLPTFTASVEVEGEYFHGGKAKTKKQAEMKAATCAWSSLKDRDFSKPDVCCRVLESLQSISFFQSVFVVDFPKCIMPKPTSVQTWNPTSGDRDEKITGDVKPEKSNEDAVCIFCSGLNSKLNGESYKACIYCSSVTMSLNAETLTTSKESASLSAETLTENKESASLSAETLTENKESASLSAETLTENKESASSSTEAQTESKETASLSVETLTESKESASPSAETLTEIKESVSRSAEESKELALLL